MPPRKKAKKNRDVEHKEEEQPENATHTTSTEPKPSPNPTTIQHEEFDRITHSTIPFGDKSITCELQGDPSAPPTLIFTHGAGGGITSPACRSFAHGFSSTTPILSFQGSLNLKNRIKAFHTLLSHHALACQDENQKNHHQKKNQKKNPTPPALGGRSMGARAAVLTALELHAAPPAALVLVSYPLTGGSQGEKREASRREEILVALREGVDVLFVIGGEDRMCELAMLREVRARMRARSWVCVVRGADHGMSFRGGRAAVGEVREASGAVAARWLVGREEGRRWCEIGWEGEKVEVGEWKEEEEENG